MASDIWSRSTLTAREETRCCYYMDYSLVAKVLLYAPSHKQDSAYHDNCYSSHGALAGTKNNSISQTRRIDPTTNRTMSGRSIAKLPLVAV